jgi:hypothetical protein
MAAGDITFFNDFLEDEGKQVHELNANTIRLALITAAATPLQTASDPRWGAGGGTDLSVNEVAPGGNYIAGGEDITNVFTRAAGVATLNATNVTWAQDPANPSTARWGILYNDTDAGNSAIGFVDLGGTQDMKTADLTVAWNGAGVATKQYA